MVVMVVNEDRSRVGVRGATVGCCVGGRWEIKESVGEEKKREKEEKKTNNNYNIHGVCIVFAILCSVIKPLNCVIRRSRSRLQGKKREMIFVQLFMITFE
jgi:hypothetical protein